MLWYCYKWCFMVFHRDLYGDLLSSNMLCVKIHHFCGWISQLQTSISHGDFPLPNVSGNRSCNFVCSIVLAESMPFFIKIILWLSQTSGARQPPTSPQIRTVYLMIWWILWMHAYVYVCVHNYSIYIICIISVITIQSLYSNYILISYAIWVPHFVGHHVTSVRSSRAGNARGVGCPRFGFKVA